MAVKSVKKKGNKSNPAIAKRNKEERPSSTEVPKEIKISREQFIKESKKRAYEIYLARGDNPGSELNDWLAAEKELKEKYPSVS